MGFLSIFGKALNFPDSVKFFSIIRQNFVRYVINSFKKKHTSKESLFGFEFEFHKIHYDEKNKKVTLDLTGQHDIIKSNIESEKNNTSEEFYLAHEFGAWMLEVIHTNPLSLNDKNLVNIIEMKVKNLYIFMDTKYGHNKILSISPFPLMGVGQYFTELTESQKAELKSFYVNSKQDNKEELDEYMNELDNNKITESLFFKDKCINYHPRFGCLARNIRTRRGKKVKILVPLYHDVNTNMTEPTDDEPFPGYIYMEAMGFGMGNCCLQMTFGANCLEDAITLYDQLIPLTPLILAISSSSPFFKGKLSNYDNRWEIISKSVDDRTDDEQNVENLHKNYICKSRYSPAYSYLEDFPDDKTDKYFNDYPDFPINAEYYNSLKNNNLNKNLAKHFSNILCRDPLVIFSEKINIEDMEDMSHFENFNSTNWNSVRFKLPRKKDGDSTFKIEVRTCDLQITPFENTAMIVFVLGLKNLIFNQEFKDNKLNDFIIPISLVDKNFLTAYQRDSISDGKFYWKVHKNNNEYDIKELSINEIFNGNNEYPGLLNLVRKSLNINFPSEQFDKYIDFLENRTKGITVTDAKYMRNFVLNHPKYNKNSIISEEINFDLIQNVLKIQNGEISPKELFMNK